MKSKKVLFMAFAGALALTSVSCGSSSDTPASPYTYGTDADGYKTCDHLLFDAAGNESESGTVIGNGDKSFVFTGSQTLKKGTYVLKGWVYVADGATLTIEPGTVIKGDKDTRASLIVERGGKLIAEGSATQPIVFTSNQAKGSRKPGDWGGVILCGKAPNNQNNDQQIEGGPRSHHGGTAAADNSGILKYVRIEFAGNPFETDKEINGLTLGSVGSGTTIEYVQVSYSNDDSFEWFGGTVNCKHLVAYKGWDDDFDTDNGFNGKVQYGLAIRDPRIADKSASNGFESDNCADGADVQPYTTATFSNITVVGPVGRDNFENTYPGYITGGDYNPNNGSVLGKFQAAMHIRRGSRLSCFNSLFIGYPIGLIIDGQRGNTPAMAAAGNMKINNVWFANMTILGSDFNGVYQDVLWNAKTNTVIDANQKSYSNTFFSLAANNNAVKELSSLMLTDMAGTGANYMPQAGSPLLSGASFTDALLNGVTPVSYIGAFNSSDNWLAGWTNFDPQNANY